MLIACGEESEESKLRREIESALREEGINPSDLLGPDQPTTSPDQDDVLSEDEILAQKLVGVWELVSAVDYSGD